MTPALPSILLPDRGGRIPELVYIVRNSARYEIPPYLKDGFSGGQCLHLASLKADADFIRIRGEYSNYQKNPANGYAVPRMEEE